MSDDMEDDDAPVKRPPGRPKGSKDANPRRSPLTAKQQTFVREVKRLTPDGELPGPNELIPAALAAYDIKDTPTHTREAIASTIAGQNLRKDHIFEELAGLGITDDARRKFRAKMWEWLLGDDNQHPRSIELKMKAAQLLAKGLIPQEEHTVQDTNHTYDGRSTEDIEYFASHGHWPEQRSQNVLLDTTEDADGFTAVGEA